MTDSGRETVKEALREELLPLRMRKGNEADVAAEGFEYGSVFDSFSIFAQGNEVDRVPSGKSFKEIKSPLIGSTVERKRNVGIDD